MTPSIDYARPDHTYRSLLRIERFPTSIGVLDGLWCPASGDLARELPTLLDAVSGQMSAVDRVVYRLNDWGVQPPFCTVDDDRIELHGYLRARLGTVTLLGVGPAHRLELAVTMPPSARPRGVECVASPSGRARLAERGRLADRLIGSGVSSPSERSG
ncbi:DUF5994 family protein [Tsukamurella soli]|uniref:Uncharacterized protein n=1 Tax=Tsukamurella soli TaxID=644556 RepID=A0ABP8JR51_9ACTN